MTLSTKILIAMIAFMACTVSFAFGTQYSFTLEPRSSQVEISQEPDNWIDVVTDEKPITLGE